MWICGTGLDIALHLVIDIYMNIILCMKYIVFQKLSSAKDWVKETDIKQKSKMFKKACWSKKLVRL